MRLRQAIIIASLTLPACSIDIPDENPSASRPALAQQPESSKLGENGAPVSYKAATATDPSLRAVDKGLPDSYKTPVVVDASMAVRATPGQAQRLNAVRAEFYKRLQLKNQKEGRP